MTKTILLFSFLSIFILSGFTQVKFNISGTKTDLTGGVHTVNLDPNNLELQTIGAIALQIQLHNNTGSSKTWTFTRNKVSVPNDWSDYVCVVPGDCYLASTDLVWTTPNSFTLADGDSILLNPHFEPTTSTAATGRYRFYVGDRNSKVDSIDVQINFTLGLKSIKNTPSFSMTPNPAADNVTFNTNGAESATIKIIDVLGNNVLNETISGAKKIDVSDFKNGIYFVSIETSELKVSNRKLVIRH